MAVRPDSIEESCPLLNSTNLRIINAEVFPVRAKWRQIGVALNISYNDLDAIALREQTPEDRLLRVLDTWLKRGNATWRELICALLSVPVGETCLARTLQQHYCPQESIPAGEGQIQSASPLVHHAAHANIDEIIINRDIRRMQENFRDLVKFTRDSLEKEGIKADTLAAHLSAFRDSAHPVLTVEEGKLLANSQEDLTKAKSIATMFVIASPFWSFLDFEILEDIIKTFGSDENQKRLEAYRSSLTDFLKTLTVSKPCSIVQQYQVESSTTLEVKLDTNSLSMYRGLKAAIARLLNVNVLSLRLVKIRPGCIELVFLCPWTAVVRAYPLSKNKRDEVSKIEPHILKLTVHQSSESVLFQQVGDTAVNTEETEILSSRIQSRSTDMLELIHHNRQNIKELETELISKKHEINRLREALQRKKVTRSISENQDSTSSDETLPSSMKLLTPKLSIAYELKHHETGITSRSTDIVSFIPALTEGRYHARVHINDQIVTADNIKITPNDYDLGEPKFEDDLDRPRGAAINAHTGDIIVSEMYQITILKLNGKLYTREKFGTEGCDKLQFNRARGVTLDGSGCIYVADSDNHRIQKFSPEGKFLLSAGSEGSAKLQFQSPSGLYYSSSADQLYVCDQGNRRVQILTSQLKFCSMFGTRNRNNGLGASSGGLCCDEEGMVYVADSTNCRVLVFTAKGEFSHQFSTNKFRLPMGISVSSGIVYVVDALVNNVFMFTPTGHFIKQLFESQSGQFQGPTDVTVKNGKIVIVDNSNSRIQIFQLH